MSRPLRWSASLALATVMLASPSVRAQARDPALATELFNVGRDLMKRGDFVAACPKLATSLSLDPKVGTMAKLAECEERLGDLVNARAHWAQAANLARAAADARLPKVEAELKRLDAVVPKLEIDAAAGTTAGSEPQLAIDAIELGSASFGVPLPVSPGTHLVTVKASGKRDWSESVATKPDGATTHVAVPVLEDQPAATAPTPVAAPPPRPVSGRRAGPAPLTIAGLVVGGAGLVALGVGGAFAGIAKGDLDASNRDGCAGDACRQPGFGERNDARTAGNVSTGLFVAGGVLAATGVTLAVLGLGTKEGVAVAASPSGLMLKGAF